MLKQKRKWNYIECSIKTRKERVEDKRNKNQEQWVENSSEYGRY